MRAIAAGLPGNRENTGLIRDEERVENLKGRL